MKVQPSNFAKYKVSYYKYEEQLSLSLPPLDSLTLSIPALLDSVRTSEWLSMNS